MIYAFDDFIPVIHESAFVHPQAAVTGNVVIGRDVYIGPGAAIRGDWGGIVIEDGCNVQENCTIHMFPGVKVVLHPGAHIGHGAIIHGATIGANCLVGMNAVLMDEVVLGARAIVAAHAFVAAGQQLPAEHLIVGSPAKVLRPLKPEEIAWKAAGTATYQQLTTRCLASLREVQPLPEAEPNRPELPDFEVVPKLESAALDKPVDG